MAKDKDQKSEKDKDAKGARGGHGKDAKAHPTGGKPALDAKPAKAEGKQDKGAKAPKPTAKEAAPTQPPRLQVLYHETVVPALMKQFGYKTRMQVPRFKKITLNMGVGEAVADKKILDNAVGDMQKIPGQKPVIPTSNKPIAPYNLPTRYPLRTLAT